MTYRVKIKKRISTVLLVIVTIAGSGWGNPAWAAFITSGSSQWSNVGPAGGIYYGAGNVGIGTATLPNSFNIFSTGVASQRIEGATWSSLLFGAQGNATGTKNYQFSARNNAFYLARTTDDWISTGSYLMHFNNNGNVGFGGITDAAYKLDVAGNIRSTSGAYFATTAGNVGIGTTTPTTTLHVTSNLNDTVNVGGRYIGGLDLTPVRPDHAVPLGYLQGNYVPDDPSVPGGIGSGTTGQTLRHNGTGWVANSILYNNGANIGIGTISPGAKLAISGGEGAFNAPNFGSTNLGAINILNTTSDRRNAITFSAAGLSNAQAGIYVHQDNSAGTHMYLATTNSYATGPQARLTIRHDGNIGIGTTLPGSILHVAGAVAGTSIATADTRLLTLQKTGAPVASEKLGIIFKGESSEDLAGIFTDMAANSNSNSHLLFATRNLAGTLGERVRINSEGNVGIGITNPSGLLHVYSTASSSHGLMVALNGNVGIGTTNPNNLLQIEKSTGTTGAPTTAATDTKYRLLLSNPSSADNATYGVGFTSFGGSATAFITSGTLYNGLYESFLSFGTRGDGTGGLAERMKITSAGNVGIGTTTINTRLDVTDTTAPTGNITDVNGGQMAGLNSIPLNPDHAVPLGYLQDNYKPVPSGTSGQTLRHNGTGWEANSVLYNNGTNVGISTTNPIAKLQIGNNWSAGGSGTIYLGSSGFALSNLLPQQIITTNSTDVIPGRNIGLALHNSTATAGAYAPLLVFSSMETGASTYNGAISAIGARTVTGSGAGGSYIDGEMMFYTAPTLGSGLLERMRITEAGNLGLGTTNPNNKLHVYSSSGPMTVQTSIAESDINFVNNNTSWQVGTNNSGNGTDSNQFYIYDSAYRLTVQKGTGNVGIGTSSPVAKLAVSGGTGNVIYTGGGQVAGLPAVQTEDGQAVSRKYLHDNFNPTSTSFWASSSPNSISNTNSGNVGIGTTNPNEKLTVNGRASFSNNAITEVVLWPNVYDADAGRSVRNVIGNMDDLLSFAVDRGYTVTANRAPSSGVLKCMFWPTGSNCQKPSWSAVSVANPVEITISGLPNLSVDRMIIVPAGRNSMPINYKIETYDIYNAGWITRKDVTGEVSPYIKYAFLGQQEGVQQIRITVTDAGDADYNDYLGVSNIVVTSRYQQGRFTGYGLSAAGDTSYGPTTFTQNTSFPVNGIWNTAGNVGIGTTNPGAKLDVQGGGINLQIGQSYRVNTNPVVQQIGSNVDMGLINYGFQRYTTGGEISFYGSNAERMRLTGAGNLGINSTTPSVKLSVSAGTGDAVYVGGGQVGGLASIPLRADHAVPLGYLQDNYYGIPPVGTTTGAVFVQSGNSFGTTATLGTNDNYPLNIETNNAVRMTVANNGNVGIGTTTPNVMLDIYSASRAVLRLDTNNTAEGSSLRLNRSSDRRENLVYTSTGGVTDWAFGSGLYNGGSVTNDWGVSTDANLTGVKLIIKKDTGNIGIGMTNPGNKFSIYHDSGTYNPASYNLTGMSLLTPNIVGDYSGIRFANSSYNRESFFGVVQTATSTGDFVFQGYNGSAYSEYMRINDDGKVGIGTTAPSSALHIKGSNPILRVQSNGSSQEVALNLDSFDNTGTSAIYFSRVESLSGYHGKIGWTGDTTGSFTFSTGGAAVTEKMRLTNAGNLGINSTTPSVKLSVSAGTGDAIYAGGGQVGGLASIPLRADHAVPLGYLQDNYYGIPPVGTTTGAVFVQSGNSFGTTATLGTNDNYPLNIETNNTVRMTVANNGNVGMGTALPQSKLHVLSSGVNTSQPSSITNSVNDPHTGLFINNALNLVNSKYGIQFGGYNQYGFGGLFGVMTSSSGATIGDLTFDLKTAAADTTLTERMRLTSAGNIGIGTSNPTRKLDVAGGIIAQSGYSVADAATDNMAVNGDFEMADKYGWNVGTVVTGGYSGKYALEVAGSQSLAGDDYIPVDPTKDIFQLEAWVKKSVAGTTPGLLYFGYYAYNENKTMITSSPCGSYCYFAASGWTIPVDGAWHKVSATTVGEGTVMPNFPVGTKYVRIMGLINFSGSADAVTLIDHITLKRLTKGPLIAGNNFSSANLVDQNQYSTLYTTAANNLILGSPNNVGIGTTNPVSKLFVSNGTPGAIAPGTTPTLWTESNNTNYLGLYSPDSASAGVVMGSPTDGFAAAMYWNHNNDLLTFGTHNAGGDISIGVGNNSEAIRILDSGHVGIGSSTPNHRLSVVAVDGNGIGVGGASGAAVNVGGGQIAGLNSTPVNPDHAVPLGYLANYMPLGVGVKGSGTGGYHSKWAGTTATSTLTNSIIYDNGTNVGVGTSNPAAKLHVFVNADIDVPLNVEKTGSSNPVSRTLANFYHRFSSSQNNQGSTLDFYGDNTGVIGDHQMFGRFGVIMENSQTVGTGVNAAGGMYLATADGAGSVAERLRINSSGNVGIGTTNPGTRLVVQGGNHEMLTLQRTGSTNGWAVWQKFSLQNASSTFVDYGYVGGGITSSATGAHTGYLGFGTAQAGSLVETMRLSSNGDLQVDGGLNVSGTSAVTFGLGGGRIDQNASWVELDINTGKTGYLSHVNIPKMSWTDTNTTFTSNNININSGKFYLRNSDGFIGIGTTAPTSTLHIVGVSGDAINVGGGQVAGLASVPFRADHAVPLGYLQGHYAPLPPIGTTTGAYFTQKGNAFSETAVLGTNDNYPLDIETNNNVRMTVASNGNVGIGTTAPSSKLSVSGGNVTIFPNGRLTIDKGAGGASGGGYFEFTNGNPGIVLGITDNSDSNHIVFKTRPTDNIERERMRVTGLGNVGIGATNPESKLQIGTPTAGESIGSVPVLRVLGGVLNTSPQTMLRLNRPLSSNNYYSGGVDFNVYSYGAPGSPYYPKTQLDIALKDSAGQTETGNVTVMSLRDNGSVGIGTTNPSRRLEVTDSGFNQLSLYRNAYGGNFGSLLEFALNNAGGSRKVYADIYGGIKSGTVGAETGFLSFRTTNAGVTAEAMRIDNNGNVGIGSTTPNSRLVVTGGNGIYVSGVSGDALYTGGGQVGGLPSVPLRDDHAVPLGYLKTAFFMQGGNSFGANAILGTNDNYSLNFETNSTTRMTIANNGNISMGNTSADTTLTLIREDLEMDTNKSIKVSTTSPTATILVGNYTDNLPSPYFWYGTSTYPTNRTLSLAVEGDVKADRLCIEEDCKAAWSEIVSAGGGNQWVTSGNNIYNSNTGNVGIGTASPDYKLEIENGTVPRIGFTNTGTKTFSQGVAGTALTFRDETANAERMRIDTNGNVGIGKTNPAAPLDVLGAIKTSSGTHYKRFINVASYETEGTQRTGTLIIKVGATGANVMAKIKISGWSYGKSWDATVSGYMQPSAWTSAGDVVVTGNPPFNIADVRLTADSATGNYYIFLGNTTTLFTYYTMISVDVEETYANWISKDGWTIDINATEPAITHTATPSKSLFGTNSSIAGTLVTGGNVGAGTSNPGAKLEVYTNGANVLRLNSNGVSNNNTIEFYGGAAYQKIVANANTGFFDFRSGDGGSGHSIRFFTDSNERVKITSGGNVGIASSTPNSRLVVTGGNGIYVSGVSGDALYTGGGQVGGLPSVPLRGDHAVPLSYLSNYFVQGGNSFNATAILGTNDNYPLNIETNNTVRMTIANNGNISMGTTSADTTLTLIREDLEMDTNKSIKVSTTSPTATILVGNYTDNLPSPYFWYGTSTYPTNRTLSLAVEGDVKADRLCIEEDCKAAWSEIVSAGGGNQWVTSGNNIYNSNSGNVGIGTSTPGAMLELYKNGTPELRLTDVGNNYAVGNLQSQIMFYGRWWSSNTFAVNSAAIKILKDANDGSGGSAMAFWTQDQSSTAISEKMRINRYGNVGIGTTDPDSRLRISGSGASNTPLTMIRAFNTIPYVAGNGLGASRIELGHGMLHGYIDSGAYSETDSSAGYLAFGTRQATNNVAEAMRINIYGNVGIGTTNPTQKLEVNGNATIRSGSISRIFMGGVGGDNFGIAFSSSYPNYGMFYQEGSPDYIALSPNGGGTSSPVFIADQNGNIGIGRLTTRVKLDFASSTLDQIHIAGGYVGGLNSTPVRADHAVPLGYLDNFVGKGPTSTAGYLTKWHDASTITDSIMFESASGIGIGTTDPGTYKLKVVGNVAVTGTLETQTGSDFAEEFRTEEVLEAGTVVVMGDLGYKSAKASLKAYDRTVIGIVSDSPSIIAGRVETKAGEHKAIIAMSGVVSVKATSANGQIRRGDLLVSSNTEGLAMKSDGSKPGTVIGKALEDLSGKQGTIKVLINLQ